MDLLMMKTDEDAPDADGEDTDEVSAMQHDICGSSMSQTEPGKGMHGLFVLMWK